MTASMTSLSDPLRFDAVATPGGGRIGMTICPGKTQHGARSGDWARDLGMDLDRIRAWGATAVATLMEQAELDRYGVGHIGDAVRARGMEWHHLPIRDFHVPEADFERRWTTAGPALRARLLAGEPILLHCRGGLGRSGMIAARLLIELGAPRADAIAQVRAARPGTIETPEQEAHLLDIRPA